MAGIEERYSTAIGSTDLRSKPGAVRGDLDIIGAHGLAGKDNGLAVALTRFLQGDDRGGSALLALMSERVWSKAPAMKLRVRRDEAWAIASGVMGWCRHWRCEQCLGSGLERFPGDAVRLTGRVCPHCLSSGRSSLEGRFSRQHVPIARWLATEIARESGRAGPAAMEKLGAQMEL